MKVFLDIYTMLTAMIGAGLLTSLILVSARVDDVLVFFISCFVAVLSEGIAIYSIAEESDLLATLSTTVVNIRFAWMMQQPRFKRIRSDIKLYLVDKDPDCVRCPYPVRCRDSIAADLISSIWRNECNKRRDEILLNTDING